MPAIQPGMIEISKIFVYLAAKIAKRLLDILAALLGLLVMALLFPWTAWCIRCDSPGPICYRAARLRPHGKIYGMLKFRTMYDRPGSSQWPRITAQDDPRITPFGRWLRASKMNELPQFWNVLVGEMSLVGPRPEDPVLAQAWPESARQEILSIRPGVTSPATLLFIDEEAWLKAQDVEKIYREQLLPVKQRLDQLYVRHHSFPRDLEILLWTVRVLLPRLPNRLPWASTQEARLTNRSQPGYPPEKVRLPNQAQRPERRNGKLQHAPAWVQAWLAQDSGLLLLEQAGQIESHRPGNHPIARQDEAPAGETANPAPGETEGEQL